MKKRDVFLLNQCFVLFGFVLSLNGLEKMGICIGFFSIIYAIASLSKNVLKEEWIRISLISFIELCLFEIVGINHDYPSVYFLSLSSLIVSFMWSHAGFKARKYGMKWMCIFGMIFLVASLFSPYLRFPRMMTLMITLSVFFPSILLYVYKQYRFYNNRNESTVVVK